MLGYSRAWLELGLLSTERLQKQVLEYLGSDGDKHSEHYRWSTFTDFLTDRSLSDPALKSLLQLADQDQDLRSSMLHALARTATTTNQAKAILAMAPDDEALRRLTARRLHISSLRSAWTAELVQQAIKSGDSQVHRYLLESGKLDAESLAILATQGANRAIRNMAKQRLKSPNLRRGT